eukprot:jgi/Psemu1/287588/fgenesh1_pg.200_\
MMLKKFLGSKAEGKNVSEDTNQKSRKRRALNDVSNKYGDKDDRHGSMAVASCTSGLTVRAQELQQKFSRKKNLSQRSRKRANERVEVTEEFDIQSVISGLTRNSQFSDYEGPLPCVSPVKENVPCPVNEYVSHPVNKCVSHPVNECVSHPVAKTVSHPVDEYVSHPVNECVSHPVAKTVSHPVDEYVSHAVDDYVSHPVTEYISHPVAKTVSHPVDENTLDTSDQWPDDETCGNHVIRITTEGVPKSEDTVRFRPNSRQPIRMPVPEPTGIRLESRSKGNPLTMNHSLSKSNNVYEVHNDTPGYEIVLASEPDGIKFGRIRSKVPAEPSGKRAETIRSSKEELRGRSNRIVSDRLQNVEVVYGEEKEDPCEATEREQSFASRRRSKSTSAARRTGDERRRARSLPRSLKRLTSKYFSSSCNDQDSNSEDNFIDNVVDTVEDEILSSLGSQLEGCEYQSLKRKEDEKLPAESSHRSTSHSSSQSLCENYEPRVCVAFSRRQSGGYFQTTCYADPKLPGALGKNENNARNSSFSPHESKREVSAIEKSPAERPKRRTMGKRRIRSITKEASRNLLLSPSGKHDSFAEEEDLFRSVSSAGATGSDSKLVTAHVRQHVIHVTPSPENEACRELLGSTRRVPLKPSANQSPELYPLSMTQAGRKDLIQQYLTLRDKKMKEEESNRSTTSSTRVQKRSNMLQYKLGSSGSSCISLSKPYSLTRKSGYDDASKHYHHVDSTQSVSSTVVAKHSQDLDTNIESYNTRTEQENVQTRSSLSVKSAPVMKKSASKGDSTGGTKVAAENLRDDMSETEIRGRRSRFADFGLQQIINPSYSYCTDDDSTEASMYDLTYQQRLNYEDELVPHNQFMKMQLRFGSNM